MLQTTQLSQIDSTVNDARITPRADFDVVHFNNLIDEKGRRVAVETALVCPCKSKDSAALSTCKNCGGTGWAFVNKRETRIVMQGFDAVTKNAGWSEELRGMSRISCKSTERLSYMDKITALDGEDTHTEVLFLKKAGTTLFAYTAYDIKSIEYVGWYKGAAVVFQQLVAGTDFTFAKNAIKFNSALFGSTPVDQSVTIRYVYAPAFYIVEFKRSTMESFRLDDSKGEIQQHLPLSAYARRAHYVLNQPNLAGDRLLNNSYTVGCDSDIPCVTSVVFQTQGNLFDLYLNQGDSFDYTLSILEGDVAVDITSRTYVLQVKNSADTLITEFTVANGGVIITPLNSLTLHKTTSQTAAIPAGFYSYELKETIGLVVETILKGNFIVAS